MKPKLSEAHVAKIMEQLLERFGEPIGGARGDGQGVPSKRGKKEDMGNRGFGAKLQNEAGAPAMCQCGGMMGMEGDTCTSCGAMSPHVEPHAEPHAPPVAAPGAAAGMAVVTVKAGPGANKGGGGKFAQGLVIKDMDGIPASGSGRGTQASKAAAAVPSAAPTGAPVPKPMPMELEEEDTEAKQERLGKDLDGDGEEGESQEHREKVLGHDDDDMDEGDLAGADELDEESTPPPPSGGSSGGGGSAPPPKPPAPPPPKPPPTSGGGGSSPPPSGGSGMDQGDSEGMMAGTKMDEDMDLSDLDEKAPPGREKQVRTLKKQKGVDNPFAVAWSSYNKSHGK